MTERGNASALRPKPDAEPVIVGFVGIYPWGDQGYNITVSGQVLLSQDV